MDYEKKYKDLIEAVKELQEANPSNEGIQKWVEDNVPQLTKSKDEKIRKEIINFLELPHPQFVGKRDHKTWITWLEKQGEQKPNNHVQWSDEEELRIKELESLVKKVWAIAERENDKDTIREMSDLSFFLKTLNPEKKGEQRPNPYSGTSFECNGHTWGMCARDNGVELFLDGELKAFLSLEKSFIYPIHPQPELAPKSALEAAKEEKVDNANKVEPKDYNSIDPHFGKPADKVVPKFKVGDWVIFNEHHNSIYQVEKIQDLRYYLRHYTGGSMSVHIDNQLIRHWTIQDAKDGDVLVASDGSIFLFAGVVDCACKYYVALTICNDVKINKEVDGGYWETSRAVHPATKEQRDLLFAKMYGAGYEWDAEKKELKIALKETQEPTDKVEPFDKYEGLTDFEKTLADICMGWIGEEHGWKQYIKDNADVLLRIAVKMFNSVQDAPFEQEPAETVKWSPQEESCICQLESLVKEQWRQAERAHNSVNIKKMSELMFFLKTLNPNKKPQRIISAEAKEAMYNKSAWSGEDEEMFEYALDMIEWYGGKNEDKSRLVSDWLKSLKDRIQARQEWSEEVEAAITLLKDIAEEQEKDYCPHNANDLRKAAQYLETCRPQNTCKPSGEHYELEEFAKIVRCNLTGISKPVQKLFKAKYLQLTGNKMYEGFKD